MNNLTHVGECPYHDVTKEVDCAGQSTEAEDLVGHDVEVDAAVGFEDIEGAFDDATDTPAPDPEAPADIEAEGWVVAEVRALFDIGNVKWASGRGGVMNQGIGLRWTNTKPPCYKGNKHRMHPFGFPTGLGPDGLREIYVVTL